MKIIAVCLILLAVVNLGFTAALLPEIISKAEMPVVAHMDDSHEVNAPDGELMETTSAMHKSLTNITILDQGKVTYVEVDPNDDALTNGTPL